MIVNKDYPHKVTAYVGDTKLSGLEYVDLKEMVAKRLETSTMNEAVFAIDRVVIEKSCFGVGEDYE